MLAAKDQIAYILTAKLRWLVNKILVLWYGIVGREQLSSKINLEIAGRPCVMW